MTGTIAYVEDKHVLTHRFFHPSDDCQEAIEAVIEELNLVNPTFDEDDFSYTFNNGIIITCCYVDEFGPI